MTSLFREVKRKCKKKKLMVYISNLFSLKHFNFKRKKWDF